MAQSFTSPAVCAGHLPLPRSMGRSSWVSIDALREHPHRVCSFRSLRLTLYHHGGPAPAVCGRFFLHSIDESNVAQFSILPLNDRPFQRQLTVGGDVRERRLIGAEWVDLNRRQEGYEPPALPG